MVIIGYILVFLIIGFIIGVIVEKEDSAMIIIVVLSVLWSFMFGSWAIATFIELLFGYGLAKNLKEGR